MTYLSRERVNRGILRPNLLQFSSAALISSFLLISGTMPPLLLQKAAAIDGNVSVKVAKEMSITYSAYISCRSFKRYSFWLVRARFTFVPHLENGLFALPNPLTLSCMSTQAKLGDFSSSISIIIGPTIFAMFGSNISVGFSGLNFNGSMVLCSTS